MVPTKYKSFWENYFHVCFSESRCFMSSPQKQTQRWKFMSKCFVQEELASEGVELRGKAGKGRKPSQDMVWSNGKLHLSIFSPGTKDLGFPPLLLNSYWLMVALWEGR